MSAADDSDRPTVLVSEPYDRDRSEPVSTRIVRLVAVAADRAPTDLDPLGNVIDPEALDRLLDQPSVEDPDTAIDVTFHYEGFRIEVGADGTVSVLGSDE